MANQKVEGTMTTEDERYRDWPDLAAVVAGAKAFDMPIYGGTTNKFGMRITFVPERELARVLTQAVALREDADALAKALREAESVLKWLVLDDGKYSPLTIHEARAHAIDALTNHAALSAGEK